MDEWLKPGSLALELATAGGILGAFLLATLVVRVFWMRVLGPSVRRLAPELDEIILRPTRTIVLWGLVLTGLYNALTSIEAVWSRANLVSGMGKAFSVAWVLLAVWAAVKLLNGLTAWYVHSVAKRPVSSRDISQEAGLVRRVLGLVVLAIGLLYVLKVAGVDISPLLASGAIGGLAVALALQDTLTNLFGGFFIGIDQPVRVGDFVKLESGEEGYVEHIGWRSTRVRLLANNTVIIPNSKLSQSVITNYFLPQQEMLIYVPCGVAYGSDLQRVENVVMDVARKVMQQVEGLAPDWEPEVRWQAFGDSAITFETVLRVRQFKARYKLQSEFIKALHRRFGEEKIEIPFPMRTVITRSISEAAGRDA
ncbi:MAG: mechanosensitive ion channel family protein [Planctomycetes bacterium]|nr:mechanosensitive ion channel family protein [Planctomycetota bacterium]